MKRRLIWLLALLAALAMPVSALGAAAVDPEVDMLEVDHKLYELGYRDSACNGELDEVTINALRNFQAVNGLQGRARRMHRRLRCCSAARRSANRRI